MTDDPFARAAARVEEQNAARRRERTERTGRVVGSLARTGFRIHVAVFVAVNLLLVVIWATTTQGVLWFLYPLLGWGIGLAAHYAAVERWLGRPR